MTEYEIADLAISNQAIFWEQSQTMASIVELIQGAVDRIAALLFGYLTVAYLVGAKLNKAQVWIFTLLYLAWQLRLVFIMSKFFERMEAVNLAMTENGSGAPLEFSWVSQALPTLGLMVVCILASVYFMWSVRSQPQA